MSEESTSEVVAPVPDDERTGSEMAYDALDAMSLDSISALKGVLRYVAATEGREVSNVRLIEIAFTEGCTNLIIVRGVLVE